MDILNKLVTKDKRWASFKDMEGRHKKKKYQGMYNHAYGKLFQNKSKNVSKTPKKGESLLVKRN